MVTLLLHVKAPPGVENVRLLSWLPLPENGTEPEKVEPPKIKLELPLLLKPVPDEEIEPPFIVKVCPEKSRFPKLKFIYLEIRP